MVKLQKKILDPDYHQNLINYWSIHGLCPNPGQTPPHLTGGRLTGAFDPGGFLTLFFKIWGI